ncbi:MAG: UDP-3-O-(3-hydroxymyristoyl)glucosamine N-acyltransferase [bacterium]
MAVQLADLAVRFGCEIHGDPDTVISCVAPLEAAEQGAISFLANPNYRKYLPDTVASAVILKKQFVSESPVACLIAEDPYLTYARIAAELYPETLANGQVHPGAVIGDSSIVPDSCEIAAGAVIGNGVTLGERVIVGPNSVLADNVTVGADTRFAANVSIYEDVEIGERCLFHSGAVIGADGFGIAQSPQGWVKVPQVGSVTIGNDVEVGANTTIDCGAIRNTRVGNGVKLDNLVQIGHNVVIGDHTVMASQSGISGSTKVGSRCVFGGKAAVAGHLEVVDDVILLAKASVSKSILKPGMYSNVIPAEEARTWRKIAGRIKRLDDMAERLKQLEKDFNELQPNSKKD